VSFDSVKRILVVDDEKDIVMTVSLHLEKNGFVAVGFSDPHEALEEFKLNPTKYSMVLTDIRMPGMSGIDLATKILDIDPKMKILIITANEVIPQELPLQLPFISVDDIIRKPFKLALICSRVKQLLAMSR